MAWLTSLLKKPDREAQDAALLNAELTPEEAAEPVPVGPQLALLVPDMAGISSFRLRKAWDAASAGEHIASLRADIRHETHAFWALHEKPIVDESTHVEALVLIRAQTDSDLVYVVSFLDIESALSFTRFEVRRGLYLGNVMIYWAAFAQLREELDGVSVTPEFAPPTENYVLPVHNRDEIFADEQVASVALVEPVAEPTLYTASDAPVEAEARQAVEEYLRPTPDTAKKRRLDLEVERIAAVAEQPVVEAETLVAPEATTVADPVFEDEADDLGPLWPEVNAGMAAAETETDLTLESPVAEEQAAIEEAFVFQHKTVEFRPAARPSALQILGETNGLLIDHEPEQIATFGTERRLADTLASRLGIGEPEPGVETIAGDEEVDFVPLSSADPAAGFAIAPKLDDFDVAYEVERLLRGRKWEQRNGPFSGFQSPPGRF